MKGTVKRWEVGYGSGDLMVLGYCKEMLKVSVRVSRCWIGVGWMLTIEGLMGFGIVMDELMVWPWQYKSSLLLLKSFTRQKSYVLHLSVSL